MRPKYLPLMAHNGRYFDYTKGTRWQKAEVRVGDVSSN